MLNIKNVYIKDRVDTTDKVLLDSGEDWLPIRDEIRKIENKAHLTDGDCDVMRISIGIDMLVRLIHDLALEAHGNLCTFEVGAYLDSAIPPLLLAQDRLDRL